MSFQIVPESAPFNEEQRAWLNGFFAGVLGVLDSRSAHEGSATGQAAAASLVGSLMGPEISSSISPASTDETFPWHDPALPLVERMQLANGMPKERRLMAAMAQLDCGSCGYQCKSYAEAIATGAEKNLTLCSPGGNETAKAIRTVLKDSKNTPLTSETVRPTNNEPHSIANATKNSSRQDAQGTRNNPVRARLKSSQCLNGSTSEKDTRHVVIDLSESRLPYRVGDALGIYPSNCSELISRVISAARLRSHSLVQKDGATVTLERCLSKCCLRNIPHSLVEICIEQTRHRPKHNGAVERDALRVKRLEEFLESDELAEWDILEFAEEFGPLELTEQEFVESLSCLRPRLYSIASSPSMHADEVHLTVGKVATTIRNRIRKGVASTMFADRLQPGDEIDVFIHPSHGFTIPSDPNAAMIMVGPGTGIAPFIAFLQQRFSDQSMGKNWLFFGDQRSHSDFLYRDQLLNWKDTGFLTRLDLAFSRDTNEKVYVQHRMRENGQELFQWLEQGAHLYVCGDASRMAIDVENMLIEIIALHGTRGIDQAKSYLKKMASENRYVRDVY